MLSIAIAVIATVTVVYAMPLGFILLIHRNEEEEEPATFSD